MTEEKNNQIIQGNKQLTGLTQAGLILTIIGAALWCITIIGMAWAIPMIVSTVKRLKGEVGIKIGYSIISLLFFGLLAGIFLLVGGNLED